jgi:hypothetical protein
MRTRRERNPATQMIIGLFVIGIGLLFLLDNLGWLDLDFTLHILPTVLIGAGILKMMQTRTAGGAIVGGGLILFGGVILLQEMGFIHRLAHAVAAADDLAGLSVVFKSARQRLVEDGASAGQG